MVVAALLSSVRLASLSMEMERSGEEKQAAGERGERRGTVLVSVRRVEATVELAAGLAVSLFPKQIRPLGAAAPLVSRERTAALSGSFVLAGGIKRGQRLERAAPLSWLRAGRKKTKKNSGGRRF